MAGKRSDRGQTRSSSRARELKARAREYDEVKARKAAGRRPMYIRNADQKAEQMSKFLAELRKRGNVRASCDVAGLDRTTAYTWRQENETFKTLWLVAIEEAVDLLEAEAWRRGHDGIDRPITHKGKITDHYKEYSDRMLEILLKGHRKKYRDKVEVTGEDGGPISVVKRIERVIVKPGNVKK